jgi:hypothetical protein
MHKCWCCKRVFTTRDEITQEWFCFYCDESNLTNWKCSKNHDKSQSCIVEYAFLARPPVKKTLAEVKLQENREQLCNCNSCELFPIIHCPCCRVVYSAKSIDGTWFCNYCDKKESNQISPCGKEKCAFPHLESVKTMHFYRFRLNKL